MYCKRKENFVPGQFPTLFQQSQSPPTSNPFNMPSSLWNNDTNNVCNTIQPNTVINGYTSSVNPFRTTQDNFKGNGFHSNFQTTTTATNDFSQINGTTLNVWPPNPFKVFIRHSFN